MVQMVRIWPLYEPKMALTWSQLFKIGSFIPFGIYVKILAI